MKQPMRSRIVLASGLALAMVASPAIRPAVADGTPKRPNILFIIMDDVSIDQMRVFGYGARVRHLYHHDDAEQTAIANRIVNDAIADGENLFVSAVVLAETSLVLSSVYHLSRRNLLRVLEALWNDPTFLLEHQGLVRAALDRCRTGSADLNDYLIGEIARQERASTTYTFDRKLRRAARFTWLAARTG
jgi:predicted nucleic-acid-binding protein